MRLPFTILFFAAAILSTLADGILWAGIADTHYGGTGFSWEQGTNSYSAISNEVFFVKTNYAPNFFIHAGDVGESENTNYTVYLTNMLVLGSMQHYEIAGNHDVANANWTPWTNFFTRRLAFTNGNYIFIGLGSYWTGGTNGTIDSQDLDFTETVLTNSYPLFTNFIVFSHISAVPDATFGEIENCCGLARLTNLFNYYKVIMYIHGHQHSVDASPSTIAGTTTFQQMIPSLTRYLPDRGAFQLFALTNTSLIMTRYRTDTHAVVSSITKTVPQYVANWPPGVLSVAGPGQPGPTGLIHR